MKLSQISEKTDIVKMFAKRLAAKTKQKVISTTISKTERITGVSARSVSLSLSGGQTVKFSIRIIDDEPDIFRVLIQSKNIPLVGGFDASYDQAFNIAVDAIASEVIKGQPAFDRKQQKVKTTVPKSATAGKRAQSKPQKIKALTGDVEARAKIVKEKTDTRNDLAAQLAKIESTV